MSAKNKWLIKSDHKILGPYSFEQVEDLIMKKQISLIDEIRDMDHRWSFVREVSDFKHFVEKVRKDQDKKGDLTQTIQTALQKTTTRAEKTETENKPHYTGVDFSQIEHTKTPVVENETPNKLALDELILAPEIKKEKKTYLSKPPVYGGGIERKDGRPFLKVLAAVFILSGLAIIGWYYNNSVNLNKGDKALLQQMRKYNLYAQDEKGIELYRKLPPDSQERILVDIIPMWPKLEAAGVLSNQQQLDLMTQGKLSGNERKSQYQLVKFNKAFNLGDIQNARDALVKAISLDPASPEVKENDAVLAFSQKNYAEAAKIFKNLYDHSGWGRHLYGFVLSTINNKSLDGAAIFPLIEKHLNTRVDFGKELALLQLYIIKKFLPDNNDMYQQYRNMFIQFPYQFSKYFKVSNLVNQDTYNWDYLVDIKKDFTNEMMFQVQFLIEKGDYAQAQNFIQTHPQTFNEAEKLNLDIAINYLKGTPQNISKLPTSTTSLYLSTQLYLLLMYVKNRNENPSVASSDLELQYVNSLMKEKLLFSNWAQIMPLKMPQDKDLIKNLINKDSLYANDFLPYLELKAIINE